MLIAKCSRVVILCALLSHIALADDVIRGIQPAALDQPRIYLSLRRGANGAVLATTPGPKQKDPLLGDEIGGESISQVEAFLDTGASGIMLSNDTAKQLHVGLSRATTQPITFEDVGVGGSEKFGVSEPLYVSLANYPNADARQNDSPIGPVRLQVKTSVGMLDLLSPGTDIAGMPVMVGKIVTLDPTPLANYEKIKTAVLMPNARTLPKVNRHVPLSMVSFAKFTKTFPLGSTGPNLAANPMIGPDPFDSSVVTKPAVTVYFRGKKASGTFLLDTGAASSMISSKLAATLGANAGADGTYANVPKDRKFDLAIGGIGGAKDTTGIFFDRLEIPTREGMPIAFETAPLLVSDISVADASGKTFTLDGVLGMNYLVASAEITGGILPDIGKMVDGPFKSIVIDFSRNELGVEMK